MTFNKYLAAVSLAALAGCGVTVAEETAAATEAGTQDVSVQLDKESRTYTIDWPDSFGPDVVVEVSNAADATADGVIIAENPEQSDVQWTAEDLSERHYFTITPENGEPVRTALRLLPLEGGRNFRDLGGYETEDGRTVKWGKVYRSGVMDGLTDSDYEYLSGLGIQVICDLRTAQERNDEPTDWRAGEVEYLSFPDPEADDTMGFMAVLREPDATPQMVSEAMAEGYSHIAREQTPAYREMFDRLAAGEIPLAFNCSAGKDRTGIAAALLLTALGVPRETVVADYALSETYVDYMQAFAGSEEAVSEDSPYAFLAKLPPEIVAPLMRSDPLYIETAFADIEAEHGSVMAFLETEIEVTDEELATIRAALLN